LPPEALRGNEHRLQQYPTPALATPRQRAAAVALLGRIRAAARRWPTPARARRAGFDTKLAERRLPGTVVAYLHAENRAHHRDRRYLVPARPEALIYANVRGRPLALVGAMFSMPRGKRGPNPGGPITRWHTHTVCARGATRGVAVRADGSCPRGTRKREGSEMLHVWFTRDLRSQFAVHGPEPELCRAGLLATQLCRRRGHVHAPATSRRVQHPPPRPQPNGG
jgi:hypothetical protein